MGGGVGGDGVVGCSRSVAKKFRQDGQLSFTRQRIKERK